MSTTQLPSKLTPYSEKTLIIIADHQQAYPILIRDRIITSFPRIHTDDTDYTYTDKEGFSYSYSKSGTVPGHQEKDHRHYERVFLNYLITQIKQLDQAHQPAKLLIIVPESLVHLTEQKLPGHLSQKASIHLGNLVKMDLSQQLTRVEKQLSVA
jgi:hypothetical protein